MAFERVHTMTDFYDCPRRGIADFDGAQHLYESEWDEASDEYASTYRLSPVSPDTFRLAMEDWAIWRRWLQAYERGHTTLQTHPALPADRARHLELANLLAGQLVIDELQCVRVRAEFRSGPGSPPLRVQWSRHDNAKVVRVEDLKPK